MATLESAALVVALLLGVGGPLKAQGAVPGTVGRLLGSWEGSGQLLGRPAVFTMTWTMSPTEDFVRLSFRNGWVDEAGERTPVISAEATYRFTGDQGLGVWIDDRPQQLRSRVTLTESTLVVRWTADAEEGRTEYRIEPDGTVTVRDVVFVEEGESLFGEASYRRTTAPGR